MFQRDKDKARERALTEMFPGEDMRAKLAMMSRTPPHMIIPMVAAELLVDIMESVKDTSTAAVKRSMTDREIDDGHISQEQANALAEEDWEGVNLLKKFIERWDWRMIGRDGKGREDLKELFGMAVDRMKEDEQKKLILQ